MYINWHLHSKKVKAKNAKKAKGNKKKYRLQTTSQQNSQCPTKLNLGGVFKTQSNIYDRAFCKRSR